MRIRSLRRATAVTTLALASVAAAAACTSTPKPPEPGPTGAAPASAAPAGTAPILAIPAPATTAPVKPVHDPGPPATGRKCLGAVVHRINAADAGPPWQPLCITLGGVLRFENLGPDSLSVTAREKADCGYAAGTFECRLIHTGPVRFTVTRDATTRSLSVVITRARTNPGADPACPRVTTYTLDATDDGPPWRSICMKRNTTLRIVNFGPGGFTVSPAANVSGGYEAGVRQFRFVRTGTVRFTLTYPDGGTRTFTVVVNN